MFFVCCVKQISWRVIPVFVEIGPNFDKNPSDWLKIPGDPDKTQLSSVWVEASAWAEEAIVWFWHELRILKTKISPIFTNKNVYLWIYCGLPFWARQGTGPKLNPLT